MTVTLNTIVANDAIITNSLRQQVEIVLSGDKRRFDQLNPAEISATLDLTDLPPGDWVKPLSPVTISINNLPQGITLEEVRPNNMAIKLDAVSERDVAVRVDLSGSAAPGFEVYTTTAMPQRIRVRGSANLMKLIDYVQTEKIDVSGRNESFSSKQVAVNSPNPSATVLNTIVDVFVVIGERRFERSFTVPVAGEPGKMASFVILGPRSTLQQSKTEDFKVDVFLDENGDLKPRLVLPNSLDEVSEVRNLRFK
jgi:YbbR domain-containing protein